MYATTGDPELKKRVDYMVDELAKIQKKYGNGYAGPVRPKVWENIFGNKLKVHQWGVGGGYVPWYVLHKTFAGLLDAYEYCGNKKALEIARTMGVWAKKNLDKLDDETFQKMLICEWGGMGDALARVYELTGDKDCLALARRFDEERIIGALAENQNQLPGKHINTQMPKIIGSARLYELEGKARDRAIADNFWEMNLNGQMFAMGGVGRGERYFAVGEESKNLDWSSAETCCTYNLLKLARHKFSWEPTADVMDYYERGLYNHILGSQEPETGGVIYCHSLKPGHFKVYSTPFDSMWCCVGTGMENHAKYNDTIYYHKGNTLFVNLYIPSILNWRDQGVTVTQKTTFPKQETTTLTFRAKEAKYLAIKVRIPYWAEGATISVNGMKQPIATKPSSYATVERTWKTGDKLTVNLPMKLWLHHASDDKSVVAVMYGPLVLAGELGTEGMPKSSCFGGHKAFANSPVPPMSSLVIDPDSDPSKWLVPVRGKSLTWKTKGVGKPKPITLSPLGLLHNQRYNVYWKTLTEKEWADRPAPMSLNPIKLKAKDPAPGIAYAYYEAQWNKLPDFSKEKVVSKGVLKNFGTQPAKRRDGFGFVFTGYIKISQAGDYRFGLASDDGSKLWINDKLVLDADGIHAADLKPGPVIKLNGAGYYKIRIDYFEAHGGEGIRLQWYPPTKKSGWQSVPQNVLYH